MARPVAIDHHDRRRSPPQCRTSPSHQLERTLGEKQRSRSYKRPGQRVHAAGLARTMSGALIHGLSNARVESVNTKLRLLTRIAFGFRSPEALVALAMLDLGGMRPPLPGRAAA
jgi:transposase